MFSVRSIRFRYTLRALFVFMAFFGIWCAYHANRTIRERRAVRVLDHYGATFRYRNDTEGISFIHSPSILYQRITSAIWREPSVTSVAIVTRLEPEIVEALAALPQLRALKLNASLPVGADSRDRHWLGIVYGRADAPDGSIARVLASCRLRSISLDRFSFSNSDFDAISRHVSLEELSLEGTNLSDETIAKLIAMPKLRQFRFCYCQVTGEGLAEMHGSISLERIFASGVPLSPEFAAYIAKCPRFIELTVSHPKVGDDFVASLGAHSSLRSLSLGDTSVTEKSIEAIEKLPELGLIHLPEKTFTKEGRDRLRLSRPHLQM
jgi:hypothetical protein